MIERMINASMIVSAAALALASVATASDIQTDYGKPGQGGKAEQKGASYAEQKMSQQKGSQAGKAEQKMSQQKGTQPGKAEQKIGTVSKPEQKGGQAGKADQKTGAVSKPVQKGNQAGKADQKISTGKGQQKFPSTGFGSQKGGQKSR